MFKLPEREISLWQDSAPVTLYPKLDDDLKVDIAIVGGGIAGLNAGYLLKKAGFSVAIIEKHRIASGTTGRTTGKVTSQHGLIYADLQKHLGEKTARLYGQANQTALLQIEKLIKKEKISCDWCVSDNFVYTRDPKKVKKYRQEADTAAKLGLPATFEERTPLPFDIAAAVKFSNQAYFNAAKYCASLASKINGGGSYVFDDSEALFISDGEMCEVRTRYGLVCSKEIIVATNVPTFPLLARGAYCILEYPQKSYIVAAKLKTRFKGMYISDDKKEYSILPVKAGKDSLLLIGGQSHIRGAKLNKKTRHQRLADYAAGRFDAKSIDYMWSAWDYQAYDDVPLVGKMYPWSKHLYVVSAFRKWGLSNSMVAAMILRDRIAGEHNDWEEIYNPLRKSPVLSIPRVAAKYIGFK
jgi:glycine/D-amino acid oxidase-like deaminating enzyme